MTKTHNKKDKLLKQYFSNISLSLIRSRTEIKCNSYLWSICIKFLNHCHHQKYTNRQFKMAFTWKPVVLWHCGLISYFSLGNLQPFQNLLHLQWENKDDVTFVLDCPRSDWLKSSTSGCKLQVADLMYQLA